MEANSPIYLFQNLIYNQALKNTESQRYLADDHKGFRAGPVVALNPSSQNIQPRRARQSLNLKAKREIFELSKQGLTHRAIANRMKVGRSTVTKILLNRNFFAQEITEHYDETRKRVRSGAFDELEFELFKWCIGESNNLKPKIYKDKLEEEEVDVDSIQVRENLTKEDIVKQANYISNSMGLSKFVATHSWFFRFRRRFRLKLNDTLDEKKNKSKICKSTSQKIPVFSSYILSSNVQNGIKSKSKVQSNRSILSILSIMPEPKASRQNFDSEHTKLGFYPKSNTNPQSLFQSNSSNNFDYGSAFLSASQNPLSSIPLSSSSTLSDRSYFDFTKINSNCQSSFLPDTQMETNMANLYYNLPHIPYETFEDSQFPYFFTDDYFNTT